MKCDIVIAQHSAAMHIQVSGVAIRISAKWQCGGKPYQPQHRITQPCRDSTKYCAQSASQPGYPYNQRSHRIQGHKDANHRHHSQVERQAIGIEEMVIRSDGQQHAYLCRKCDRQRLPEAMQNPLRMVFENQLPFHTHMRP